MRQLVSHEDLCHMDLVTDVNYGRQGVSSSMILRHQGRGSVWNQSHIHTHTHTRTHARTLTQAHTQRAVHLKVDHTTAKERFLPITTACCSCLPLLAAITSPFSGLHHLFHMQHANCSFWFVSYEHFPNTLLDIAWPCVVEGPFTSILNVTEHILTEHINQCTKFAL